MSRRRRSSSRLACFGPVLPAGVMPWDAAGQPYHAAGALAMLTVALLAVPGLMVLLLTWPTALPGIIVPRAVRAAWRYGLVQEHVPLLRKPSHPRCPAKLRRLVIKADRSRCVYCRRRCKVQADHLIPWAWGGLMGLWNLTCLCPRHNKVKSDYWESREGIAYYRPFGGARDLPEARRVLAACRRARLNPLRYLRAAWALG